MNSILKQHIELRGDDPLKAVISGTKLKAYLVAEFAIGFDVETAGDQYGLDRADIHAALAFYYDNLESIEQRLKEVNQWLRENAVDGQAKLQEMRERL